ncbi:MAG: chromate transporter [Clostridiaceae bacterium]|nr:chromate transporter [Clostridiaceae bacterium]
MIYLQLFYEFAKVGLFTVGGGMACIPFLLAMAEKTGWFTQAQLLDMIAISESTPGPIGINMATFTGYLTAGVPGAIIATLGIVLPTVILVLFIAKFLQTFKDNEYVIGAMYGLRPASAALIASAGVSVAVLSLVNTAAVKAHEWGSVVELKSIILAAILLVLTNKVTKTKNLHPVFYIAASAVIGIVFRFAGA